MRSVYLFKGLVLKLRNSLVLALVLLISSNAMAIDIVGTYTGNITQTSTAAGSCTEPTTTISRPFTFSITSQTLTSPDAYSFTFSDSSNATIFETASSGTGSGSADFNLDPATFTLTDTGATPSTVTGTIAADGSSITATNSTQTSFTSNVAPFVGCLITETFPIVLTRTVVATNAVITNPEEASGSDIVSGTTESLSGFVQATVAPVVARLKSTMISIQNPGVKISDQGQVNASGQGGDILFSGQTGRSAGEGMRGLAVWGSLSGTKLENKSTLTPYDGDRYAVQAGIDFLPTNNMVVGVSVSFETTDIDTEFNDGEISGFGFTVSPYIGAILNDSWSLDGVMGVSNVDYDQFRIAPGTTTKITSRVNAERVFFNGSVNYNQLVNDKWFLLATGGLSWARETQDQFIDSSNVITGLRETQLTQGSIGAEMIYLGNRQFEPYINATYNYDIKKTSVQVVGAGKADNDDVLLGVGFNLYPSDTASANVSATTRLFRDNYEEYSITASFRQQF